MKRLYILYIVTVPAVVYSQDNIHEFQLGYSNNGNIKNEVHDFYFNPISEYGPGDDVSSYQESSFKFSLNYGYTIKENWQISAGVGFGRRKDSYDISNQPGNWTGSKIQNYYSMVLSGMYLWKYKHLEIGSGLEVPVNIISDHVTNSYQEDPSQQLHFTNTVTGGSSFGINAAICFKFFFNEYLFLHSKCSFGYTHLDVGDLSTSIIVYQNPSIYPEEPVSHPNEYKKDYFSSPELSFGFGIRL